MRDLGVHVGEGIEVYLGIFLSGKSVPRGVEVEVSRNYLLTDWEGQKVVVLAANRRGIGEIV